MGSANSIKVWDPLVRVFHWSLVLAFAAAYLTGEDESRWHEPLGYAVLGLIAVRAVWGLIGTEHARFRDFVFRPATVLAYARDVVTGRARRYLGHNPLGGVMIVALLLSLLGAGVTGLVAQEAHKPEAAAFRLVPAAYAEDHEHRETGHGRERGGVAHALKEVHEFFAHLTLLLVLAHLGGVALSSVLHRENLVRAMVTGYKDAE
jgi:cytochrome b